MAIREDEEQPEGGGVNIGAMHLDKVRKKFNLDGADAGDGGEAGDDGSEPTPPPAPLGTAPEEPRRASLPENPRFRARLERKQREAQLQRENESYRNILDELVRETSSAAGARGAQAEPIEPDYDADPKAWHRWENARAARELQQQLAPILELGSSFRERTEQDREQQAQAEQQRQYMAERSELMHDFEEDYIASEQGKQYPQRLYQYATVRQQIFERQGYSKAEAAMMIARMVDGMATEALRRNINPAAFIDNEILGHFEMFGTPKLPAPTADGRRRAAEVTRPARGADREIREMNRAATSGVAGSLSQNGQGKKPRGNATAAEVADAGRVTPEMMRQMIAKLPKGGPGRNNVIARLRQVQREIAREEIGG